MKNNQDYIQDIAEIRSMMERSSKFLSLSGWAGIIAGLYALAGSYIAYRFFDFYPDNIFYSVPSVPNILMLASGILLLALVTAIFFSWRNANRNGEHIWSITSKRLLVDMVIPLGTGGILILILITKGLLGLAAPLSLLFYGLALYNAGNTTISEVRYMGIVQILLGLICIVFIEQSLIIWSAGFGIVHIIYGIYMHFRYQW